MSSPQTIPQENSSKPYSKIMVGYDGSAHAKRALIRAAALASDHNAALTIVTITDMTVFSMAPMAPGIPEEVYNSLVDDGKKTMSQALDLVKPKVPGCTGVAEEGNAAETILKLASDSGVDLIVVGRRGISGVERFLIGGVSSAIAAHSKCDVLIVK